MPPEARPLFNQKGYNIMTYDEFRTLSEDDQRAAFIEGTVVDDLTAERDSFKTENDNLAAENERLQEELRKTKELNFTLARKVSAEPQRSAEEIMNELFK